MVKPQQTDRSNKNTLSKVSFVIFLSAPFLGTIISFFIHQQLSNSHNARGDVALAYAYDDLKAFILGPACITTIGMIFAAIALFRKEPRTFSLISLSFNAIVTIAGIAVLF